MKITFKGCLPAAIFFMMVICIGGVFYEHNTFSFLIGVIAILTLPFFFLKKKLRVKPPKNIFDISFTAPKTSTVEKAKLVLKSDEEADKKIKELAKLIIQSGLRCVQLEKFLDDNIQLYENQIQFWLKKLEIDKPDNYVKKEAIKSLPYASDSNMLPLLDYRSDFLNFDFSQVSNVDFDDMTMTVKAEYEKQVGKNVINNIANYAMTYALIIIKTYQTAKFNNNLIKKLMTIDDIEETNLPASWTVKPCACHCCQNAKKKYPYDKTPSLPRHIGCGCRLHI